jgi:hypothetical protein
MIQRANRLLMCIVLLACSAGGCSTLRVGHGPGATIDQQPEPANTVRANQLVFHSDIDLKKEQDLLQDLGDLPEQICKELRLTPSTALINVYLFKDADRFRDYLNFRFQGQNLPDRRAFFIDQPHGKEDDLLVYVFWSDSLRQDLRHELTHALLHSVLKTKDVPLWLDEGLAVYFEQSPERKGINYQHVHRLCSKTEKSVLNLSRLEGLTRIQDMTPAEYREAWAWVYFMLHGDAQTRTVLLDYVRSMHVSEKPPGPIYPLLSAIYPSPEEALQSQLERLDHMKESKP